MKCTGTIPVHPPSLRTLMFFLFLSPSDFNPRPPMTGFYLRFVLWAEPSASALYISVRAFSSLVSRLRNLKSFKLLSRWML